MFTKRHYEAVARAIAEAHELAGKGERGLGVRTARACLADTFKRDNPRFDRERFEAACREYDHVAEHLAHGVAIVDHRIPGDLGIPAFLRRRKLDAGEEYRLAWAGMKGIRTKVYSTVGAADGRFHLPPPIQPHPP